MATAQAILFIVAVVLLIVAAFGPPVRVSLALFGAAAALLAYALPVISAGL